MQKNIGTADQYLRLVSGIVALTSAGQCRRNTLLQATLMAYGAMKVAEGVTGWCPVMHALGVRTDQSSSQSNSRSGQDQQHGQSSHRERQSTGKHSDSGDSSQSVSNDRGSNETEPINTTYQ